MYTTVPSTLASVLHRAGEYIQRSQTDNAYKAHTQQRYKAYSNKKIDERIFFFGRVGVRVCERVSYTTNSRQSGTSPT